MPCNHQRTIENILTAAAAMIANNPAIDNPRLVAQFIVCETAGLTAAAIRIDPGRAMEPSVSDEILTRAFRVADGEPLQLVLGTAPFLDMMMKVRRGVFIPRPETEILVETAARLIAEKHISKASILDLCAGTGVAGIGLLSVGAAADVTAVDINPLAVELARENAQLHNLSGKYEIILSDLYAEIPRKACFDAIVSNPPYIPTGDIEKLDAVVRDYDPRAALDGGPNGTETIYRIVSRARRHLKHGGLIAIEIGAGQAASVLEILADAGFSDTGTAEDLSGIERVITGWAN